MADLAATAKEARIVEEEVSKLVDRFEALRQKINEDTGDLTRKGLSKEGILAGLQNILSELNKITGQEFTLPITLDINTTAEDIEKKLPEILKAMKQAFDATFNQLFAQNIVSSNISDDLGQPLDEELPDSPEEIAEKNRMLQLELELTKKIKDQIRVVSDSIERQIEKEEIKIANARDLLGLTLEQNKAQAEAERAQLNLRINNLRDSIFRDDITRS